MAKNNDRANNGLSAAGFLFRFVAAIVLVAVTYNPSGESAYHWISAAITDPEVRFGPLHLILLAVLAIGWVIYWVATWRALGAVGVTLAIVLLGGIIWLLFDLNLLESKSITAIQWISLVCLSAVLAIGVYVNRRTLTLAAIVFYPWTST